MPVPTPSYKIATKTKSASPTTSKARPGVTSNVVSGPDEFDVLPDTIGVNSFCPTPGASNGVSAWLCVDLFINQGFGSTYYQQTFHWTLTDACGTVLFDLTDYQSVLYYGAGYYTWERKFRFPSNEPSECDGTWTLTAALTQTFPDGQTLSGTVTSPVTVFPDARLRLERQRRRDDGERHLPRPVRCAAGVHPEWERRLYSTARSVQRPHGRKRGWVHPQQMGHDPAGLQHRRPAHRHQGSQRAHEIVSNRSWTLSRNEDTKSI